MAPFCRHASRTAGAIVLLLAALHMPATAQSFTWTRVVTGLPSTISVYAGTAPGPIYAYYAEIDHSDTLVKALALRSAMADKKETVSSFAQKANAYVAINGGFFGGTPAQSYSLVISDGRLVDKQLAAVTRTAGTYPLMRANFGIMADRSFETAWIYHFDNEMTGLYRFLVPLAHTTTTIAPAPLQQDGTLWAGVREAIGGGPNLVSNGQVNVTYDQEVMFGSGVGLDNGDPRTAIGYTADGKIILFVVDGRGASLGMSLPQVAQTMIDLGCVEAVNLDGGGSSTFYADGMLRNTPSDGGERLVASAFAVVPAPSYDNQMDTEGPGYSEIGSGWLSTIDPGFFGTQRTRIVQAGSGDKSATFRFTLPKEVQYELYAWWTASVVRATNTPFIVYSKGQIDTVRVDQTTGGGRWNLLGTFTLPAGLDSVVISNEAVGNSTTAFIAVDGLRVLTYDRNLAVSAPRERSLPSALELDQNFPNPFNPRTTIRYRLSVFGNVSLRIYDVLGRTVATLVEGDQAPGEYRITWNASAQPSGLYFCELTQNASSLVRRMLLVR